MSTLIITAQIQTCVFELGELLVITLIVIVKNKQNNATKLHVFLQISPCLMKEKQTMNS